MKLLETLEHKTGLDLTVSSTLKKPSKYYTCFILRRFGFLDYYPITRNIFFLFFYFFGMLETVCRFYEYLLYFL